MVEKIAGLSVDEFISRYDEQGPFELVDGEIITMSPPISGHSYLGKRLFEAIFRYDPTHKFGEAFIETTFAMSDDPNWVKGSRVPDVMFIRTERWAKYVSENLEWRKKPLFIVPDLVVEIVSPNDRYGEVQKKVAKYLADGVQMAWVMDEDAPAVTVFRAGSNVQTTLTGNDSLDGGDIIPGFSISVASIFED